MNLEARLDEVRTEYLHRIGGPQAGIGPAAMQADGEAPVASRIPLADVLSYISGRSGKMLRPRMLLAAAATQGGDCFRSRRTLLLAVCVEMLHNASLLHDDIIDRALTRRGQPSVNARWGNGTAVLVGDWLLTQVMQLLDEADDREATRRVNRTVQQMVLAELAPVPDSEEAYLKVVDGKTASLFATACWLGNPAYEAFGLHYGRLFQLRDDLADGELPPFGRRLIEQEELAIKQLDNVLNL